MKRGYLVEIVMTVKNMVYIIVLGVFYLFLIQEGDQFSRATIMLTGVLYGMFSYLMRTGWKVILKKRSSGGTQRPFASDHHDRKTVTVRCKEHAGLRLHRRSSDRRCSRRPGQNRTQNPRRTGGIEPCRCSGVCLP